MFYITHFGLIKINFKSSCTYKRTNSSVDSVAGIRPFCGMLGMSLI